jgi:hypothetical protein
MCSIPKREGREGGGLYARIVCYLVLQQHDVLGKSTSVSTTMKTKLRSKHGGQRETWNNSNHF